jgi:hypothetical protein
MNGQMFYSDITVPGTRVFQVLIIWTIAVRLLTVVGCPTPREEVLADLVGAQCFRP